MQKYNNRSEVPEEFKWDLTPFFKDEKEYDEVFSKTEKLIKELNGYVGCTKDANLLYEFLCKQIEAIVLWEDLYVYSYLINDQELGISKNLARKNQAENLNNLLVTNTSFFESELLKLDKDSYEELFKQNKKLEEFRCELDKIYRNKEHILSEKEEIMVSSLVNAMDHYEDMSSNMLNSQHDYGKIKLEDGTVSVIAPNNFRSLMRNSDVKIRKRVYNLFNKKLSQYSQSNALFLSSYVAMNDTLSKIYNFKSSWDKKLFSLNLSDKVFKTLVKTTEDNLTSLHRYYDLKRRSLGLPVLNRYDLYLEMAKSDKEYSIPEAQQLVRRALEPLGEEYLSKYDKIVKNRYIDYCQYKGKCSGGYSFSTLNNDSRILLSFNGDLDSVSTIAHEAGHNVHHQFVNANNKPQYRSVGAIVSEVASLTNECLLSSYLVNNGTKKEEKLAGIANILGVITSNLFGSVREGKLEQEMYNEINKGRSLTKEFLDKKSKSSLKKYYGSAVKTDKYACNAWVNRSHYYMHFYLYNYAICISVASNVALKILNGDKEMLNNYIEFLKCGEDKWPSEAFKVLGIDLEDKEVYENAIKYFDSLMDDYERIMNEEVK